MYIYRLRVRRIFTSTLPLEACLNTNYCFFLSLSLSLGFFYMLVIQMRILRINGVNCHKNGHMCVIEVERKITSLFYVNSYIYIYFWIKKHIWQVRGYACTARVENIKIKREISLLRDTLHHN